MKNIRFLLMLFAGCFSSLTAVPLDLLSIKGTVHAVKYGDFEDENDFIQQIICNEGFPDKDTTLSKFEFLVSSADGYYGEAQAVMGNKNFKALGFKGSNSRLFVDGDSIEFDDYRGALMSLSSRSFGAGMPTLEKIFQGPYNEGYIGYEKEEFSCLDYQWIVERYSNLGATDVLIFSKDESSACGVSLRFSFRTIKNDEDIETGMLDMFAKGVVENDPTISDESLNQLVEEHKRSIEFTSELKQLLNNLKSSREVVIINKYERGACYQIGEFLEALASFVGKENN